MKSHKYPNHSTISPPLCTLVPNTLGVHCTTSILELETTWWRTKMKEQQICLSGPGTILSAKSCYQVALRADARHALVDK